MERNFSLSINTNGRHSQFSIDEIVSMLDDILRSATNKGWIGRYSLEPAQPQNAVELGTTGNKQSTPPVKCECCHEQDAVMNVCHDCYMAT